MTDRPKARPKPKEKVMDAEKAKKSWLWRNFSAMITENKGGVMALSLTRSLALVTFVPWLTLEVTYSVGVTENPPSMTLVGILGSLVGIKGFKDGMKALKGGSSYKE